MYTWIRPLLFSFDSESIHNALFSILPLLRSGVGKGIVSSLYRFEDPALEVTVAGLKFKNPVGLAAGFDKRGIAPDFFEALGFGHIEVGTITAKPQEGNPRPRIFRYPNEKALINRLGFPSEGADAGAIALSKLRERGTSAVIGVNIGKTKSTPIEGAVEDYLFTFERVVPYADYVTINVSSPNTPELRKLQEPERLAALFSAITRANSKRTPLFVKIAPDLERSEIDDIVRVVQTCGVSGIIATNTTISREGLSQATDVQGGMSGKPLYKKSLDVVSYLAKKTEGKIPIIGVGGISSGSEALAMLASGASLIQLYSGLIFEGPGLAQKIKMELLRSR